MAEIQTIRRHIQEMLETRGEDASYIEEHGDAVEPHRYNSEIITLDTDKTTVFYALTKDALRAWKDRKEHESHESLMSEYRTFMSEPYKHYILVLVEPPSPQIMGKLTAIDKALAGVGGAFQVFYTKELLYNPMKHALVPLHEKLSEAECKQIMESYMIKTKNQMPIISHNDPIARWMGLRGGDLVRITRHNATSGTYYYYRCCV